MIAAGNNLWTGLGAVALLALGLADSAQADPHHAHAVVTPASSSPARDGISGSSVGRVNAHGKLGGPATPKPSNIGSVNLKQPH